MNREQFLLWEDLVESLPELQKKGRHEYQFVQLWQKGKIDAFADHKTGRLKYGVASVSLHLILQP